MFIEFDAPPNMTDTETAQFILDEILYDRQPGLQSSSMVGTTARGIDKNPNYHTGHYSIYEKEYTITWCKGTVKIREGIDPGWYCGPNVGKTLHEGPIDWPRIRKAFVMKEVYMNLGGREAAEADPQLLDAACAHLMTQERYMLNSEIV